MLLSPKTEMGKTDFTVVLDYGIGEPYQVNYSYPIFGQIAGGSTNYSGTVYSGGRAANYSGTATTVPQYGVVGAGSGSITNYVQYVHIFILEGKLNQEGQVVRRYEGKAQGAGYLTDLTKIAPSGLKALFLEFPGPSGVSKTETFFGVDQIP